MFVRVPEDLLAYIFSYLDGYSRIELRAASRYFAENKLLMYDGPAPYDMARYISLLPQEYCHLGEQTPNCFWYCECPIPLTHDALWIRTLANNTDISASTFVCAWRCSNDQFVDISNEVLRDAVERCEENVAEQRKKIYYLLDVCTINRYTQDYVLRLACLQGLTDLIDHLVLRLNYHVSSSVIMATLISSRFSKVERISLLQFLLSRSDVVEVITDLDYWNLKFPLHSDDWDTFALLYKSLLHSSHVNGGHPYAIIEQELCYALPVSRRGIMHKEIVDLRLTECAHLGR